MPLNSAIEQQLLMATRSSLPDSLNLLRVSVDQLSGTNAATAAGLRDNTLAVLENTTFQQSRSGNAGEAVKNTASSLGAGLFLSPLITGLRKLFGGGTPAPPPELPKYSKPPANQFEFGAFSLPERGAGVAGRSPAVQSEARGSASSVPSQINIHVQALDSRSIVDRSDDIARALKRAILHSHSVNGAIAEV